MQPNPAPDNPLNNKDSGNKIVVTSKKQLRTIRMARIRNIKVQFRVNAGPQINAGTSNKRVYFKFDRVDPAFILTRCLCEAQRLIEKIPYFYVFLSCSFSHVISV